MCRAVVWVFAALYAAALALLIIGTVGLFGVEPDPLSGVFLMPLGLPWIWLIEYTPEDAWPLLAIAAPALNLFILWRVCRWLRDRRADAAGL
jgi:hypothetical protein